MGCGLNPYATPIVIDPPNDGNYTISFTAILQNRLLVGANDNAAGGIQALGPYMLCLEVTPMCDLDLRSFYPQERA